MITCYEKHNMYPLRCAFATPKKSCIYYTYNNLFYLTRRYDLLELPDLYIWERFKPLFAKLTTTKLEET